MQAASYWEDGKMDLFLPQKIICSWDMVIPTSTRLMTQQHIWGFPKIGVPQNGWFILENPMKMDDLGENPLF